MNPLQYFYHWTHKNNLGSVLACGLDPKYAQSALPVVWFCDADVVGWAMKHIATRHEWKPDEMVLIRFPVKGIPYAHTAFPSVYTTNKVVRIGRNCGVKEGVLGEFVSATTIRRNMGSSVQMRPDTGKQGRE